MKFLNPLGLLGLLGVPIIIYLYILKQKHIEKNVSSTFIWRRAILLFRKKIKWQWLNKYLLIMLQLLLVILMSFSIAQPVINSEKKEEEYIIILDTSASMSVTEDKESRLDRAIDLINKRAKKLDYKSYITIIEASSNSSILINHSNSFKDIKNALKNVEQTYVELDMNKALSLAKEQKGDNAESKIVIYSDKNYSETGDVELINISKKGEFNFALLDMTAVKSGDYYTFSSNVISYGKDGNITIGIYVDDVLTDAKEIECKDGDNYLFEWTYEEKSSFDKVEFKIEEEDCLKEDNNYITFSDKLQKKILIISKQSLFLRTAINLYKEADVTTVKNISQLQKINSKDGILTEEELLKGYDLYVFDNYLPNVMPKDGAIIVFNPASDVYGVDVGDKVTVTNGIAEMIETVDDDYITIMDSLIAKEYDICEFVKINNYDGFESLMRIEDNPLLLVGKTPEYETCTIFNFDVHNTNLPMLADFPILMNNILNYSFQEILEENDYQVGEYINVRLIKNCNQLFINDEPVYVAKTKENYSYLPEKTGECIIMEKIDNSDKEIVKCFVHLSNNESNIFIEGESLGLGETLEKEEVKLSFFEELLARAVNLWKYFAISLLILLIIEWWVYYNEEY